jgi:beta-ribofuranosylaminobenzene 5'-phosphate synthase
MTRSLIVTAPTRLHFGLLSFGNDGRQFGGAGVMLETPQLKLGLRPATQFTAAQVPTAQVSTGEADGLPQRVVKFAENWAGHHGLPLPGCEVAVLHCPPQHVGLGVGTQLGLAVAAGLNAWTKLPEQSAVELATSVGRGLRSAVGTYGFMGGGFIVERGKLNEPISPLDCQIDVPSSWRFVLVRPELDLSVSGAEEQSNFAQLPPVKAEITNQLVDILKKEMVPGVATDDFDLFSDGLFRYGQIAGSCFETIQGGPYNGERITRVVQCVRQMEIVGVGQSSWGPTVFAATRDQAEAEKLSRELREHLTDFAVEIHVGAPSNTGAHITDSQIDTSLDQRASVSNSNDRKK